MKTVFHVSSPDSGDQQHAMINAANLLADESVYSSGDEVVILANGAAVRMFVEETADHSDMVESLLDDGVSLRACGNALASMNATDDDLLAGVERVPSGSGELARLEDEGFGACLKNIAQQRGTVASD
jgi:intracellular sulfur oxidation DsrE/DsrF family protein